MASSGAGADSGVTMADVLQALKAIQENQNRLATEVQTVSSRLDTLAPTSQSPIPDSKRSPSLLAGTPTSPVQTSLAATETEADSTTAVTKEAAQAQKSGFTSRIILT